MMRAQILGDYPLEKLTQTTRRPEPLRLTRVTPRELSGKRTRAADSVKGTTEGGGVRDSPSKAPRRA